MNYSITYGGWQYSYDDELKHQVICNDKRLMPKSFYKYYALSEYSVDALTNLYIYASHPNQLNDPMDCNNDFLKFDEEKDIKSFVAPFYDEILSRYNGNVAELIEFVKCYWQLLVFKKVGILSLTTSNKNSLMWSLYAKNRGFCIEFDCSKFGFENRGPFPIHYMDEMSELPLSKSKNANIAALIQTTTKTTPWKYEDEWRLIVYPPKNMDMEHYGMGKDLFNFPGDHNRKFLYSMDAVKSITLGYDFFSTSICINISDREVDVYFNEETDYACKVLNFLSNPKLSVWKFFKIEVKNGKVITNEIEKIIHLDGLHYRVIFCNEPV